MSIQNLARYSFVPSLVDRVHGMQLENDNVLAKSNDIMKAMGAGSVEGLTPHALNTVVTNQKAQDQICTTLQTLFNDLVTDFKNGAIGQAVYRRYLGEFKRLLVDGPEKITNKNLNYAAILKELKAQQF